MAPGGRSWSWVAGVVVMMAGPAAAQTDRAPATGSASAHPSVLLSPVQGSESIGTSRRERVADAVRRALEARGHAVVVNELLGRAVVACQSPECVEQNLDAAGADLAIVPAMWVPRGGGEELTLTLLQRAGRNLNVSGEAAEDPSMAAAVLVDRLLAKRAAVLAGPAPEPRTPEPAPGAKHPHAWKAGPALLIAGGGAAFIAIGVGAAVKRDDQQLDRSAVAAWSAVGAAAIAGGAAWWVVGAKRRERDGASALRAPALALRPTRIDLRLRF